MKQGRLINFELLWDTDLDVKVILPKMLELDFQKAVADGITTIIGVFLMEGIHPYDQHNFQQFFLDIKKLSDKYNLEIIILSGLGENFKNIKVPFKLIYTPNHLRTCFNMLDSISGKIKNNNNDKFLFLGGVPSRLNRIYLLSKLYDNNFLSNAEWSFFIPVSQEDQDYCRNLLSHYSDNEYETFLKKCTRSVDNKYQDVVRFFKDYAPYKESNLREWVEIVHTDWWKNPIYIDPKIYNETSLSIISEGINFWGNGHEFITEKTWRTIIYKHPFIFAGYPEQFDYIKKLGFKTFEEYMLVKDYAQVEDEKERIELIVKNIEHFLKHRHKHRKEIQQDIDDNFNLFLKLANDQDLMLSSLKVDYNIPDDEFSKLFNVRGWENIIRPLDDVKGLI